MEAELKDTAKQYLWTLLKKECWDEMVTKGKHILAFHSNCDIVNYPMRQRSAEEIEELEYAIQCLEIERIEKTSRVNAMPPETAAYSSLIGNFYLFFPFIFIWVRHILTTFFLKKQWDVRATKQPQKRYSLWTLLFDKIIQFYQIFFKWGFWFVRLVKLIEYISLNSPFFLWLSFQQGNWGWLMSRIIISGWILVLLVLGCNQLRRSYEELRTNFRFEVSNLLFSMN